MYNQISPFSAYPQQFNNMSNLEPQEVNLVRHIEQFVQHICQTCQQSQNPMAANIVANQLLHVCDQIRFILQQAVQIAQHRTQMSLGSPNCDKCQSHEQQLFELVNYVEQCRNLVIELQKGNNFDQVHKLINDIHELSHDAKKSCEKFINEWSCSGIMMPTPHQCEHACHSFGNKPFDFSPSQSNFMNQNTFNSPSLSPSPFHNNFMNQGFFNQTSPLLSRSVGQVIFAHPPSYL